MRMTKAGARCGVLLALMACPAMSGAQPGPATPPTPLTFKSLGQPPLFVGYSDFLLLMAATTWVESEAEPTKLIPVEEEKARKIGRLIGKVL